MVDTSGMRNVITINEGSYWGYVSNVLVYFLKLLAGYIQLINLSPSAQVFRYFTFYKCKHPPTNHRLIMTGRISFAFLWESKRFIVEAFSTSLPRHTISKLLFPNPTPISLISKANFLLRKVFILEGVTGVIDRLFGQMAPLLTH